jgi:hypothetical protein
MHHDDFPMVMLHNILNYHVLIYEWNFIFNSNKFKLIHTWEFVVWVCQSNHFVWNQYIIEKEFEMHMQYYEFLGLIDLVLLFLDILQWKRFWSIKLKFYFFLPAFHKRFRWSWFELNARANICDSTRQSIRRSNWSRLILLYIPWSSRDSSEWVKYAKFCWPGGAFARA